MEDYKKIPRIEKTRSDPYLQPNSVLNPQRSHSPRAEKPTTFSWFDSIDLESAKIEIERLLMMLGLVQERLFELQKITIDNPPLKLLESDFNPITDKFSALVHVDAIKPPVLLRFAMGWTVEFVKTAIMAQFFPERDVSAMYLTDDTDEQLGPSESFFLTSNESFLPKALRGEMPQFWVHFTDDDELMITVYDGEENGLEEKSKKEAESSDELERTVSPRKKEGEQEEIQKKEDDCDGNLGYEGGKRRGYFRGSIGLGRGLSPMMTDQQNEAQINLFKSHVSRERNKGNGPVCLLTGIDSSPIFGFLPSQAPLEEGLKILTDSMKKASNHFIDTPSFRPLQAVTYDMSIGEVPQDAPFSTTTYFKNLARSNRMPILCACPTSSLTLKEPEKSLDTFQPSFNSTPAQTQLIEEEKEETKTDFSPQKEDDSSSRDSDLEDQVVEQDEFDSGDEKEDSRDSEELNSDVNMEIHHAGKTFFLQVPRLYCVRNVIETVCQKVKEDPTLPQVDTMTMFLTIKATHFIIRDLETAIHCHPVILYFEKKNLTPSLEVVSAEFATYHKNLENEIGNLVQVPLAGRTDRICDNDASDCRIKMARIISFDPPHVTAVVVEATSAPLPAFLPDRFTIRVYSPSDDVNSKTLQVESHHTIQQILETHCHKIRISMKEDLDPNAYIFKICGREQYFLDTEEKMNNVIYIRECLKNMQPIVLTMVPKAGLPLFLPPEKERIEKFRAEMGRAKTELPLDNAPDMYGDDDVVSLLELKRPFEFRIIAVRNVYDFGARKTATGEVLSAANTSLFCEAGLYHGGEPLCKPQQTKIIRGTVWNQWLRYDERMCDIPEETRVCITLYARSASRDQPLGHVNYRLFNFKDHLLSGHVTLKMWPDGKANPIGTCVENLRSSKPIRITLGFHVYPQPIAFPRLEASIAIPMSMDESTPSSSDRKELLVCIGADPLQPITQKQKELLWRFREYCLVNTSAKSLVKVLQSVHWNDFRKVQETYRLLSLWPTIVPKEALELLDAKFADKKVREFAVKCLEENLSDANLKEYLLQLVQVLKYEPHHYSALAGFLMRRALLNPFEIGHAFFWHLQAEMHVPEIAERYGILLELYLTGCGQQRDVFVRQKKVLQGLESVSDVLKKVPQSRRKEVMHQKLAELDLPDTFRVPVDPTFVAKGLIIDKCKTMDSAKAPLWLVFENADRHGDHITVLFKAGDDLRQDILTLQMLNIMDHLWKLEGLDLHLTPYKVIATGEDQGMIEVVLNSATVANIQKAAGGVTGAFKQTTIVNWLKESNNIKELTDDLIYNFMHSCAGYCVATYVLGIGDRHNDNIMVNKNGHLFHIDFGHFLGNFKTFAGVARERAPFVFTQEFAHVMGGPKSATFKKFEMLCCKGYNILRKHANVFINLFAMMLSTGIPELQSEADIQYLRDAFALGQSDEAAGTFFCKLIRSALGTKATNINFAIHIWAHSD